MASNSNVVVVTAIGRLAVLCVGGLPVPSARFGPNDMDTLDGGH